MSPLLLRPTKTRVRAPRVEIDLAVVSKTLGTEASYAMSTMDVSKSGLLLAWDRKVRMPFIENTLIEMTIDPGSKALSAPVPCLGKVIRRVDRPTDGNQEASLIGVQIVQMDGDDINVWEKCLDQLEERYGVRPSPMEREKKEGQKRVS